MDEQSNSGTIFNRLDPPKREHLKPLSIYSRMVMCDQKDGPHSPKESTNPFVNLKIKVINDGWKKRRTDCSVDDDYSSPCKKQCITKTLSPDLGCVMDYSSSLTRNNLMSPFVPPYPKPDEETLNHRSEIVSSLLEHVERGCAKDEATMENILKKSSIVFDKDVDDILCHNDKGYVSSFLLLEKENFKTEGPQEQQGNNQAPALGQHFSFLIKDSSETVSGSLLAPVKCETDFLEGEDEVLNIGQPMFESSICQSAAATEHKSEKSEAPEELASISQSYNSGDFTVDSLYGTTLPLEVQVKSKVIVPSQTEGISQPAASTHPEQIASSADQNGDTTVQSHRVRRPQILDTSMEWEQQKRRYIFCVRSHMNENPSRAPGPMTELLDLMTHVAGQTGSRDSQWQHPSDLTCRNYQKRFGKRKPTMTLSEWQVLNQTHDRRFLKVPKIFQRSPFP